MILIIKAADKSYFLKIMVIFILTGIEEIAVNKTMKLLTAQRFVHPFSITLLLLLGISALAGGWGMIGDPSGEALGWTTEMLIYSPFNDYMIPGIMLFLVPGVVSIVITILVIKKVKTYPLLIIGQGSILLL